MFMILNHVSELGKSNAPQVFQQKILIKMMNFGGRASAIRFWSITP